MSRPAIVFVLLVAIASVVLGTYYLIFPRVADVQRREQITGLSLSGRLLQEMDSVDEARLTRTMIEFTQRPNLRAILQEKPSDAGRETWLGRLRTEALGMSATARATAPIQDFFILDSGGMGLVRANDLRWTGKPPTDNPRLLELVRKAQAGTPQATLAVSSNNLCRAIAVPLLSGDSVMGMVLAIFPLDERVTTMRSGELGLGFYFAYLGSHGIFASTLDPTALEALKTFILGRPDVVQHLLSGERVEPWIVESGSRTLQALGLPVTVSGGRGQVVLVVFRELLEADRLFGTFRLWLFGNASLVLMVLVIAVALFGGRLARGMKQLEQDALKIAGGDAGHSFKSLGPAVVRSLAKLLNTIRSEAKGEEVDFQSPQPCDLGEGVTEDSGPEDEQAKYARCLFNEFVRAKQKAGEETSRLDFGRFHAKLLKQEEALKAKHSCQAVRFEVTITANQVKLRPRFIRDTTKS
jgi:hypothetical protein